MANKKSDPLEGSEFLRITTGGSRMGTTTLSDQDFGHGAGTLPAIKLVAVGHAPDEAPFVSVVLSHEAATTMCTVLALALGWPSIPGENG
jgi:hypothetical protein